MAAITSQPPLSQSPDASEEPFSTVELLQDFGISDQQLSTTTTQEPEDAAVEYLDENPLLDEILHTSTNSFIQTKLQNETKTEDRTEKGPTKLGVKMSLLDEFFEKVGF